MLARNTGPRFWMQLLIGCAIIGVILAIDVFMVRVNCFDLPSYQAKGQWLTAACIALVFGSPAIVPGYWLFRVIRRNRPRNVSHNRPMGLRSHVAIRGYQSSFDRR